MATKAKAKAPSKKIDVFLDITNKVIDLLKTGLVPWSKNWKDSGLSGFIGIDAPRNFKTGKAYRGINILLLIMAKFESPWWMTFKQAQSLGGKVIKGSKGTRAVRWVISYYDADGKWINPKLVKSPADYHRKAMFPTYFSVFNAAQIEGIEFPTIEAPATVGDVEITNDPIENAEAILDNYDDSPLLKFDGRNPCYSPADDTIHLPDMGQFNSSANYYKTRFHEEIHGTGAKKRLARTGIVDFDKFGSEQYAREELIAELGACFLSEIAGIQSDDLMEDTAAYCKSWIKKLKNDPKMITFAMSGAQKATEYICGGPLTPELEGAEVSATATA